MLQERAELCLPKAKKHVEGVASNRYRQDLSLGSSERAQPSKCPDPVLLNHEQFLFSMVPHVAPLLQEPWTLVLHTQGTYARLEEMEKMGWQNWAPWETKPGSFEEVSAPHQWLGEGQEHKADLASKFLAFQLGC